MTNYANHRIPQSSDRMTPEQQRALLDWHPLFSGRCPECELPIACVGQARGDWRCRECGWFGSLQEKSPKTTEAAF